MTAWASIRRCGSVARPPTSDWRRCASVPPRWAARWRSTPGLDAGRASLCRCPWSRCSEEGLMRVVIADDHTLVRRGLRNLLEAHGIAVVGEAQDGREAVELARTQQPDIVLMDLRMPGMNGLTATRLINAELPTVKVVVLTASEDDDDLFDAVASGAQGYLLKNVEPDRFFSLLDAVTQGELAFTPGLACKVLRAFAHPAT